MPAKAPRTPLHAAPKLRARGRPLPRHAAAPPQPAAATPAGATRSHAASHGPAADAAGQAKRSGKGEGEQGAMTRRLEALTEAALEASPRAAARAVQGAGFSEELRRQLEARIADSKAAAQQHPQAAALIGMPAGAGSATRDLAAAQPWTGTERVEDAALRMLQDAHKPLRGELAQAPVIDTRVRISKNKVGADRLADARDRTSMYALSQDQTMSDKEKEEMRRLMRERFEPAARAMPATLQGLQSLASERIEDAIARGLFRDIPRGKGVNIERDHVASSPFLDTTEYFMNKIIQRQEVLPPWVEKQQEVNRGAATFRSRLRADWRRHAARAIASPGGSLPEQMARAQRYAAAEARHNPRAARAARAAIAPTGELRPVDGDEPAEPEPSGGEPLPPPFRDPAWERAELSYHKLALAELNNSTRSYNLMAPELARKPYFVLERELRACFADVAPSVAGEILDRARAPPDKPGWGPAQGHPPGVLARFGTGEQVRVWESRRPKYGFKEFWKDLFRKEAA